MRFAYGTPVRDYASLEDAQDAAIKRHSHYYTNSPGWLLRADVVSYAYCIDPEGDYWGSTAGRVELFAFPVKRFTPHGATLREIWSGARERWVDLRPGKQWASRTAEEAIRQLAERRRRHLYILSGKTKRAEYDRDLAERTLGGYQKDLLA